MKRFALLAVAAIVGVAACGSDPADETGANSPSAASPTDDVAVETTPSIPTTIDLPLTTSTPTATTVQRDPGGLDGPVKYAAEPLSDGGEDALSTGELRLVDGCLVQGDAPPYVVVLWRYGTAWQARPSAVVLDNGTGIAIGDSVGLGGGFHSDLRFWVQDVEALTALERCQAGSDILAEVFVVQHRGAEIWATEPPTTIARTEPPEPTIYRPEPIRSGALVTAAIVPAEGVALEGSTVSFQIVEMPDGRFLQSDLAHAVAPTGAEFWTVSVNGRLKSKTTALQGTLLGSRIDPEHYGNSFTVSFSATTSTDEILASTGEIQMND